MAMTPTEWIVPADSRPLSGGDRSPISLVKQHWVRSTLFLNKKRWFFVVLERQVTPMNYLAHSLYVEAANHFTRLC